MTTKEMLEEARIIRDSSGAVHGMREAPNVSKLKRLCAEAGITNWREVYQKGGWR